MVQLGSDTRGPVPVGNEPLELSPSAEIADWLVRRE